MADIRIKNPDGDYIIYRNVPGILIEKAVQPSSQQDPNNPNLQIVYPAYEAFRPFEPYIIQSDDLDFDANPSSQVIVPDLPASTITVEIPDNLFDYNIKHGVTIAGIEGSYAGGDMAIPLVTVTANELTFASGSYHVTPPQTPVPYAYMEEVVIEQPTNLLAANIKSGVTIAGIPGTYTNVVNNGATASDILSGKIAFVNGQQITGSLINDPYTIPGSTLNFSLGNITYYTTLNHVTDTIIVTAPTINPKDIVYGSSIVGIAGELELSYFSVRSIPANTSISTSDTFYFDIVSTARAIGSTHSLKNWLSSTTYTTSQGISKSYTGLGNFYGINLYASGLSSTQNTYAFVQYDAGPIFDVIYSDVVVSSWGMTSAGWQKSEVHPLYAFTFTDRYCFENDFDSYVDDFMSTYSTAFGPWISGGQVGPITVTPSVNSQIILPASVNLDAFNEVDVDAIPYGETDNAAGGKTADIGDNAPPLGILKTSWKYYTGDTWQYTWSSASSSNASNFYTKVESCHGTINLPLGALVREVLTLFILTNYPQIGAIGLPAQFGTNMANSSYTVSQTQNNTVVTTSFSENLNGGDHDLVSRIMNNVSSGDIQWTNLIYVVYS